jgi:GTP-binding protein
MEASFVGAYRRAEAAPDSGLPEVAVVGRSNCGKSSLINALTGRKKLARTSKTPGRTQEIVFFSVRFAPADPFFLVDLPGYGFARVSKTERAAWGHFVGDYVGTRETLKLLLVLNDLRREPREEELNLLRWADERGINSLVVLTKADKIAKNKRLTAIQAAKKKIGMSGNPMVVSVQEDKSIVSLRQAIVDLI